MAARRIAPGTIVVAASALLISFDPMPSGAIQLRWSSGDSDLSFAAAHRCTLLVAADAGEVLPADWRLVWVAASDSGAAAPLLFEAESEAGGDPAATCEMVEPSNPASVAARVLGARFCSASPGEATTARLVINAPEGSRAKLQIVGFIPSPADTMSGTIIRSSEITQNGGCDNPYPPLVFRAASSHHYGQLDVRLVGANLEGVSAVPFSARDSSWSFPLSMTSRSDERVTAHAALAAPLPETVVGAEVLGDGVGAALVPADNFAPLDPQSCSGNFEGAQDTTGLQPKDFAFLDAGDTWHVFYTRQYQTSNYTDRTNTRRIGHAVSMDQNLSSWTVVDRNAIQVRPGRMWDNLHVWAPTIVQRGITYYMFYTGVQLDTLQTSPQLLTSEIQRVGIATSVDLNTWTQDAAPVYFNKKISWTFQDSTQHGTDSWQFRDPFVMPDPGSSGNWLMYFVTIDSTLNRYVVGVAATDSGNIRKWHNVSPLRRTSTVFMNADRDESPHALFRHGKWWLLYTSNHPHGDQITYSLNGTSPVDSGGWSLPDSLKAIACEQHPFPTMINQWHGTEYLGIGSQEFLSAFADNLTGGGEIQFTQVRPPDATCPTDSIRLACPDVWTAVESDRADRAVQPVALRLAGPCPARSVARLQLVLRSREPVHVAIYDLLGRRIRTLADGPAPAGTTVLSWDGHRDGGWVASSGVYFARAVCGAGQAMVRIPLIR